MQGSGAVCCVGGEEQYRGYDNIIEAEQTGSTGSNERWEAGNIDQVNKTPRLSMYDDVLSGCAWLGVSINIIPLYLLLYRITHSSITVDAWVC